MPQIGEYMYYMPELWNWKSGSVSYEIFSVVDSESIYARRSGTSQYSVACPAVWRGTAKLVLTIREVEEY